VIDVPAQTLFALALIVTEGVTEEEILTGEYETEWLPLKL